MKNHWKRMFEHAHWANLQVLNALQSMEEKPEQAVKWLAHILSAEKVWLDRLNEKESPYVLIWPDLGMEECQYLIQENYEGYQSFLERVPDTGWFRSISYRNSKGEHFQTSIIDILTHVSLHGSYHRGQISSYLRKEGYDPVNTDYITFVRQR